MDRTTLHIVCGDSRSRAEQARIVFALGHHAEVYGELGELLDRPPLEGIVMAADGGEPGMARELIRRLGDAGMWLPVIIVSPHPETEQVVDAIKAGALDYLRLPLEMGSFARRLSRAMARRASTSRRLDISPRTVEIHRGNMMTKLRAGHAADAVRLWLDARLVVPGLPAAERAKMQDDEPGVAGTIGRRDEAERRPGPKRQRQ